MFNTRRKLNTKVNVLAVNFKAATVKDRRVTVIKSFSRKSYSHKSYKCNSYVAKRYNCYNNCSRNTL